MARHQKYLNKKYIACIKLLNMLKILNFEIVKINTRIILYEYNTCPVINFYINIFNTESSKSVGTYKLQSNLESLTSVQM